MLLQRFFVDGPNSNRMNESLWARLEISLNTSRNNIWKALTYPNLTQKYMYNCRLNCNWSLGSPAHWVEVQKDGAKIIHVEGELIEYSPYDSLRFKIFHGNKILKGYVSELRFLLRPQQQGVLLVIEQGDFSTFPQGYKFYNECFQAWEYIQKDLISTCLSIP